MDFFAVQHAESDLRRGGAMRLRLIAPYVVQGEIVVL